MSLVSPQQSNTGETIEASDINNPINQLAAIINGGIDNSNIAASAGIDPSKLAGGNTGMYGAWTAWTPTYSAGGGSLGNVTGSGRYIQMGKTVHFRVTINMTSIGTATGNLQFTLPITCQSATAGVVIASGRESAAAGKMIVAPLVGNTIAAIIYFDNTTSLVNGTVLNLNGTYEAA